MLPVEGPAESTRTTGPLGNNNFKKNRYGEEVGNLKAINSL